MEKAYDLKVLGARLKEKGLVELEDSAEQVYAVTKEWLKESAQISKNPYDNLVSPFLDSLDSVVNPQIDKIDGSVSNP